MLLVLACCRVVAKGVAKGDCLQTCVKRALILEVCLHH